MKLVFGTPLGVAALLIAMPALSHHAGVMFDADKRLTLTGTVKDFQWTNPHCWIQLLVPNQVDNKSAPDEWSIQMASPLQVLQGGWKPGTLKPGDKIVVIFQPMRDGSHGGNFVSATGPQGEELGKHSEPRQ